MGLNNLNQFQINFQLDFPNENMRLEWKHDVTLGRRFAVRGRQYCVDLKIETRKAGLKGGALEGCRQGAQPWQQTC